MQESSRARFCFIPTGKEEACVTIVLGVIVKSHKL